MNTKHITTEEKFYICDGCKVYFSTEEEDDGSIWLIGTRESVSNIRNFYIPNTINGAPVVYIEGDIFDYNNALEHFIVEDDNEYFRMYEGGLYSKDMKKFYFMPPKFDGKVFFVRLFEVITEREKICIRTKLFCAALQSMHRSII